MNNTILRHLAATCCAALVLTACPSDDSATTNAGTSDTGDSESDSDTDTVSDSVSITVTDTATTTNDPDTTVGPETTDTTDTTTDSPTTTDATTTDATTTDTTTTTDATTTDATTTDATTTDATTTDATTTTDASTTDATTGGTSGGTTGGADCPELDAGGDVPAIVAIDTTAAGDDFTGDCGGAGGSDVTVAFTAPADGDYYITTLRDATVVDTVVYVLDGGCDGTEIACNDDAGQGTFPSFDIVTLAAGQAITVVVDGFDGDEDGVSELYIDLIPAAADGGACCIDDSGVGGCDGGSVEACVCGFDPFCCDTEWDASCVAEAQGICNATCEIVVPACEAIDVASNLDGNEPTYNRVVTDSVQGNCLLSGSGSAVFFDVYDYTLAGGGPHDLTADMCAATAFDSFVTIYQAADGSVNPFNPADACANIVTTSDDACGAASLASTDTLVDGAVQIVVTSFNNGTTGNYSLNIDSTTCQ